MSDGFTNILLISFYVPPKDSQILGQIFVFWINYSLKFCTKHHTATDVNAVTAWQAGRVI